MNREVSEVFQQKPCNSIKGRMKNLEDLEQGEPGTVVAHIMRNSRIYQCHMVEDKISRKSILKLCCDKCRKLQV